MTDFYNEIDQYAAQWLRNLIAAGHIPPGVVDQRSIVDIDPAELRRYTQCHFFAGIGIWAYALRRAGWPTDRPVWTGSCPCQPFSGAGKGQGHEDERHLWPAWERLIRECRPDSIFGEQVSGPDGLAWLDLVCTDLEDSGYTVGAVIATAAGVGAPHGRHRIYFMADANDPRFSQQRQRQLPKDGDTHAGLDIDRCSEAGRALGDAGGDGAWQHGRELCGDEGQYALGAAHGDHASVDAGAVGCVDDPAKSGLALWRNDQDTRGTLGQEGRSTGGAGPVGGFWADAEWVLCRDPEGPRWRPIEPGSFPLASGASGRVGRLRAYGNGLCAETAVNFIRAAMT